MKKQRFYSPLTWLWETYHISEFYPRSNNRKVVTLQSLHLFVFSRICMHREKQPPRKNHGFTRQIAYAYKAGLFYSLPSRRTYTHVCILCVWLFTCVNKASRVSSTFSIAESGSFQTPLYADSLLVMSFFIFLFPRNKFKTLNLNQ